MIKVQNLYKQFDARSILQDINFSIGKGEIVGFLGENGAGKTTLMRILTAFLPPSSGSVEIGSYELATHSLKAREMVGYLPENPPLYPYMTVEGYLKFAAQLRNLPRKRIGSRINAVLNECQLEPVRGQVIETLSKGFKQRVGIAQAIIHNPQILILDEPTNGLDPVQIQQIRQVIRNVEMKRTVLISTHILSEIEVLAERVIIIKQGRILRDESMEVLLEDGRESLEHCFLKEIKGRR